MSEGAILDPYDFDNQTNDLRKRVSALEQRPKVTPARATQVRPVVPIGGFWNNSTTSATFTQMWTGLFNGVSHLGLFVRLTGITTGAGTTGEYRVTITADALPPVYSSVGVLPASASAIPALGWIHGVPISNTTSLKVDVEVRRTAGANSVFVFTPVIMLFEPRSCTTAGVWYASGWLP